MIRIASGHVTKNDLLTTDAYLAANFPRTADMPSAMRWIIYQINDANEQYTTSLSGVSFATTGTNAELLIGAATPSMLSHIKTNILGGNISGNVTVYIRHIIDGWQAYHGLLQITGEYEAHGKYHINHMLRFSRGVKL